MYEVKYAECPKEAVLGAFLEVVVDFLNRHEQAVVSSAGFRCHETAPHLPCRRPYGPLRVYHHQQDGPSDAHRHGEGGRNGMKVISNPCVPITLMEAAILKMADSKFLLFFKILSRMGGWRSVKLYRRVKHIDCLV